MPLTFKGDIVHGEKYEQNGETKWKNTKAGALFVDDQGRYRVKIFDTWFNVYPPKMKEGGYQAAKQAASGPTQDDFESEVPF